MKRAWQLQPTSTGHRQQQQHALNALNAVNAKQPTAIHKPPEPSHRPAPPPLTHTHAGYDRATQGDHRTSAAVRLYMQSKRAAEGTLAQGELASHPSAFCACAVVRFMVMRGLPDREMAAEKRPLEAGEDNRAKMEVPPLKQQEPEGGRGGAVRCGCSKLCLKRQGCRY